MERNTPFLTSNRKPSLAVPLIFLAVFLLFRCLGHAQGLYATNGLGSASFSQNWGASSYSNPYQPPVVVMKQSAAQKHASNVSSPAHVAERTGLPVANLAEPTVPGHRAVVRHGIAYAPEEAPLNVKRAIWATNTILHKPYVWGGGHGSFFDTGYDCSGTVSFALHYAGLLSSPTDSHSLMSFGEPGPGRWMTVYAGQGHTWIVIAGLRLDTTGYYGNEGPGWRTEGRMSWGYTARHPVGL